MKYLTRNRVLAVYGVIFVGIISGFLPRETALYTTGLLMAWFLLTSLEEATLFFVCAVPLFIAIPLTASYDNLNMWRPLAVILLLKLLTQRRTWQELRTTGQQLWAEPNQWLKSHPTFRRLMILFVLSALSLIGAAFIRVGIVRMAYFINLTMVPVVLWTLLRRGTLIAKEVIRAIALSTIIVVIAGYMQLASTYLMDIYQFMHLWGEGIQLRQFGTQWSYIAVHLGNTWLAYYGPQLSLRVFSLFPDSHTFPIFILMGIPALFALSLDPILTVAQRGVKAMASTRARMMVVWIPISLLIAILSGTRGIWAASIGVILLVGGLIWLARRVGADQTHRSALKYISLYLLVFFALFAVAWPIFISPQFLVGKANINILGNRIKSIIDFGETSNRLRIAIWKSSAISIIHHPLLGVGIGNFPVVLGQDIALGKAGSTAHNIYLHVAAEMGIIAGLEFIILLMSIVAGAWRWFRSASGLEMVYAGAALLYLPWVFIYLLTDAALFDERAFLAFGIAAALILSYGRNAPAAR